ncbi:sugar MFS transporter [Paraglaciecola arctica]|uniref:Glucose/galactose transporter n=1 Tax=Paraglaciecola arctica BSs20135 TaxID=493475 RepID=K6YM73_9ALTE|nr:sugar MFS transporter [Paraglaciecola arctica]GAC19262.1 glucose/galactose transporter [Paraglaciecola arctica BSs20135]
MTTINKSPSTLMPMLIIGSLFFMFGFVTWLNGSLIPFLQIACELDHIEAYFVTMAFYISYTVMALPMSYILRKTGFKEGMVLGLFVMVAGALTFIPAAYTREYSVFLVALFMLGAGLTILQTASNPYIVLLGPRESAAVRISIMGILNKGAGVIAPLVFTAFILTDMSQFTEVRLASLDAEQKVLELAELSSRLVTPYLMMAFMLLLLGIFIKMVPLPSVNSDDETSANDTSNSSILQKPQVILGAIALFFYVGAEVVAGDTIGLFSKELGVSNFGQMTSYTMGFMVLGYILGLLVIPRWISQGKALAISAVLGVVLTVLLLNASVDSNGIWDVVFGWTGLPAIPNAVLYVALFGLANALVWPAIWPLALSDLNQKDTSTASALLIMGISGGALLPLLYGILVEASGNAKSAYWIMIPCYVFIIFYAVKGHKLRQWSRD